MAKRQTGARCLDEAVERAVTIDDILSTIKVCCK